MPDLAPEQSARQKIDEVLDRCGWVVQDKSQVNLHAAKGVAVRELSFQSGEPDYTLFVDGKAIGTVDAKPEGHSLTGVEEQSEKYVTGVPVATSFRDYIETHQAEITALEILYRRPYRQRLTEPMLKELETKLRENHAAWTEDRLWDAFAQAKPGKVKGRSQAGRFADLVALVRFALEQQPVLKPFADSVHERFHEWLMDKAAQSGSGVPPLGLDSEKQRRDASATFFTPEQLAWLNLIRDHIATTCSIEQDDFDFAPFAQQGGLGKAHQLLGADLPKLLDELNEVLAA